MNILTLMRIGFINLTRDRVVQALTFLLPITFFTIFANVFGRANFDATPRVEVALVDEDHSDLSRRMMMVLASDPGLYTRTRAARPGQPGRDTLGPVLDRARAQAMVRRGALPVAVVLPAGWQARFAPGAPGAARIELLADVSDPVAPRLVSGMLQRAGMTAAFGGTRVVDARQPVPVRIVDIMRDRRGNSMIAFYAAGIAVMFLLFSCSGAAGSLIDEVDSGTLDRVLNSRAGMTGLLAGKWFYLILLGMIQITVMFLYGMFVFRLQLAGHVTGFAIMTFFTAAAVSAFGLLLATISKSRAQLSGISTITILSISAIGGSMFPRFLMSPGMQKLGLFTFNTWALEGYTKVFWRNARPFDLWPQVTVLVLFTIAFVVTARLLARRWETA